MNKYVEKINDANYDVIVRIAENLLLRPNDSKLLLGEENFYQMKIALEKKLEANYNDDDLYNYYHGLNKVPHGFCSFKRWKLGLLF